jgi:hypothetical protein
LKGVVMKVVVGVVTKDPSNIEAHRILLSKASRLTMSHSGGPARRQD